MVGKVIQRQAKKRYEGFPNLNSCWEQSKHHKKHFLDHLDCTERQNYHANEHGCKAFDTLIGKLAGEQYKIHFFNYYRIVGKKPCVQTYTNGLIKNKTLLRKLATDLSIVKKTKSELEDVPEIYTDWPAHFVIEASRAVIFPEDREEIQKAIESCITRRTIFRNACVKDCNQKIDTKSHDNFLLILQVLRARNIVFH